MKPKEHEVATGFVQPLDIWDENILKHPVYSYRRAKFAVTLAGEEFGVVDIQNLLEAGMDIARFKMTYTTLQDKMHMMGKLQGAALKCCVKYDVKEWPYAVWIELQHRNIKTGIVEKGLKSIRLEKGQSILLTQDLSKSTKCTQKVVFLDNINFTKRLQVGDLINIRTNEIILVLEEFIDDLTVRCMVIRGGRLSSLANVGIKNFSWQRKDICEHDKSIIKFALEYEVDVIVVPYVLNSDVLKEIRKLLGVKIRRPLLYSGINSIESVLEIDDILEFSDGVLFERDFFPYERNEPYLWMRVEKYICGKCQQAGVPLYITGGFFQESLESWHFNNHEINAFSNVLLKGATGFMLKDCYNIHSVVRVLQLMNKICCVMEPYCMMKLKDYWTQSEQIPAPLNAAEAAIDAAVVAAFTCQASLIILTSVSGKTAKILCGLRPPCIVLIVCKNEKIRRRLKMYRAVIPIDYTAPTKATFVEETNTRIAYALKYAVQTKIIEFGESYVVLHKGCDTTSYCDTVRVAKTDVRKTTNVECAED